jgi:NDP-sugar pyrophosphorylase family protein
MSDGHNADRPGDYIGWLAKVDRVYAHPFEGKWFDIGDLDSYREADQVIRQEKHPK